MYLGPDEQCVCSPVVSRRFSVASIIRRAATIVNVASVRQVTRIVQISKRTRSRGCAMTKIKHSTDGLMGNKISPYRSFSSQVPLASSPEFASLLSLMSTSALLVFLGMANTHPFLGSIRLE